MATLNPATHIGDPYRIPPEPSRLPSILLAAGMHAVLLGFLWMGIRWQNNVPVSVEAEVWDLKTQSAAPAPVPAPAPKPEPRPEPKPEPKPEPRPAKAEEPAPSKPDIALERQKLKEKEKEQRRLREEKLAEEKREKEDLRKKEDLKKKEELKKEQDKKELAEQKAKELEAKKAADKAAKAAAKAEEAKLAKARDAEMKRIMGAASGNGAAQQSTAPKADKGYLASITGKIKSSTTYLGNTDVPGNPRAEFKVEQLPTGEIINVRMVKSSGVPAFDDAVEKGIMKSSPLPKKEDGTVERTLNIGFSMKDLN